jgi:hypothetical protein
MMISDSVNQGSNPCPPASENPSSARDFTESNGNNVFPARSPNPPSANTATHKNGHREDALCSRMSRIITRIAKWVTRKAAYRAGIRDELQNKPLRQYRDPSLQVAYMFGRVEVREDHR